MEGPGMSLFQGAASIHINNSAQDRLEEQEEIEDQKRRNEELKHKLANAFDDLLDDDEASSVNSSGNFTLNAAHTNGGHPAPRSGLPPTYVESLNHLKEAQNSEAAKYCETPKHHGSLTRLHEDMKMTYSPYGAGDAQNHFYHQEYRGQLNGINNFEARQEYMNNEQLKVMYEMRVKECQQLAAQMEQQDNEIDSMRSRLASAVSEREKAELSLQEAHHLLASSKHKLIELEQQVTLLSTRLVESDQEKEQLRLEVRSANISLQDAQQRLHTLQVAHSHDTDTLFREQQDRHREEMDRIQNDLVKAKNRLEEKENEIKMLEKRCMERGREKEDILIEKGATINRLASELEAAQSRLLNGETAKLKEKVSQLTSERNSAKEQVKELGSKLEVTAHELVLCRNKLTACQKEYENWRSTLHQILVETLPDNTFLSEPPSPSKFATLKDVLGRYKLQLQKLPSLHEEIAKRDKKLEQYRKQESELRAKLDEQKGLEMQLNSRLAVLQNKLELLGSSSDNDLLESYKQQNKQLQNELDEIRTELKNLDLKYTELESENEKLKQEKGLRSSVLQEANAELLRELEKYSAQLKDTLKENGELKTLYLQVCCGRDSVKRELKDLQTKIEKENELHKSNEAKFNEELEKERQQNEKLTAELAATKQELERANKRILEVQKEYTDKQKEFTDKLNKYIMDESNAMRREIEPCAMCDRHLTHVRQLEEQLTECRMKLATLENNKELMAELKGKAEFFQQYIMDRFRRLSEQRCAATNTDSPGNPPTQSTSDVTEGAHGIDKMVLECDETLTAKTALMMKEKAIRDQIAEKYTLEIKTMEMNFAKKIAEMDNEHMAIALKLKGLLERKVREVDTLKDFILSERAKITKILESKENEISVLIKEHNELQAESQKARDTIKEMRLKFEKYKEKFSNKLQALESVLRNEREEWHQKTILNAQELQSMHSKLQEVHSKATRFEQRYEKLLVEHQTLQEKYRNCKITIVTYKDYMAQKDVHINNEFTRLQQEYRQLFLKLQQQLNYFAQGEQNRGGNSQGQSSQHDFSENINRLHEEFAKLSQNYNNEPGTSS